MLAEGLNKICINFHYLEHLRKNGSYDSVKLYIICLLKTFGVLLEIYANNPDLKDEFAKLLAVVISEYTNENYLTIYANFKTLPEDLSSWPNTKTEIFFYICSLLCYYSRYISSTYKYNL